MTEPYYQSGPATIFEGDCIGVVDLVARKRYGTTPGAEITVREVVTR